MRHWKQHGVVMMVCWVVIAGPAWSAETFEDLFRQGEQSFQTGDYDRAVNFYEKAIELNPNYAPLYNSLGLAQSARGANLSDVIWAFKVALDIDPKYAEAYVNMCRVYFEAEDLDSAEKACLSALAIDPNLGNAQLSLAWGYLRGGQHIDKAIYYFREVLKKTQHPTIYFGLGLAYVQQGDNVQVLETITALRGLGRDDLAQQLERAIRPTDPIPVPIPQAPMAQPGQLVPSGNLPAVTPSDNEPSTPMTGFTEIRLRGSLTNLAPGSKQDNAAHPGSLTPSNTRK